VRDQLCQDLSVDLSPTVLFDYPSIAELGALIDADPCTDDCSFLVRVFDEFGYQVGANERFGKLGMRSIEMLQIRDRLMESLQVALPLTVLFDYPTLNELNAYLATARTLLPDAHSDSHLLGLTKSAWKSVSKKLVVRVLKEIVKVMKDPHVKIGLDRLATQSPNASVYIKLLEQILISVEGPVFLKHGFIKDLSLSTVRNAQKKFNALKSKFMPQSRTVWLLARDYEKLTCFNRNEV